jgi:NADPH:quinone reductase-like Zn-dependent oxidoreductase
MSSTTKTWVIEGNGSFDSLKFIQDRVLPELTANEVLVKFHAASLNYRDVIIALVTHPSFVTIH